MNKTLMGVLTVAVLVIAIGGAYLFPKVVLPPFGANAGPDHYVLQTFWRGLLERHYFATSTSATAQTLSAADIAPGGVLYSTWAITPTVDDLTLTLPASSTMPHVLPLAGMSATQCWYNASTTAGIDITVAAGTGIDLEVASSTILGAAPVLTILSDSTGCFRWARKATSDFTVGFSRFVDGD